MTRIRNLTVRYSIVFSILIFLAMHYVGKLSLFVASYFPSSQLGDFLTEFLDIVWPVLIALIFGYAFIFTGKGFCTTFKAGCLFFVYCFLQIIIVACDFIGVDGVQWTSFTGILLGIVSLLGVGIREEVLFRGLIGNSLLLKYGKTTAGLWFAVGFSSFLFGAVHMFNVFAGVPLDAAIVQSLSAMGGGFLFAAIYLRGGNLWIPIILHALVDTAGLFESTFIANGANETELISNLTSYAPLIIVPIYLAIAILLLRKSKRDEIFARLSALREKLGIAE